jgi:glutamate racemase
METNKKTILMLDSCSGGLSVLKYTEKWSGNYRIVYVADYEKNPFGLKSQNEIVSIVKSWFFNLIKSSQAKIAIIACNTASIAIKNEKEKLSKMFKIPIITMIEGVEKCIKNNETHIRNKNVAIVGTKYTIESREYLKIVKRYNPKKIIEIIATMCEREVARGTHNSADGKKNIIDELCPHKNKMIGTVILACTCLKTINHQIKNILGNKILCLDPAIEVSKLSKKLLNINKDKSKTKIIIYNTAKSEKSMNGIKNAYKINTGKMAKIKFLKLIR